MSCLIALARTASTEPNTISESGVLVLFTGLSWKLQTVSFSVDFAGCTQAMALFLKRKEINKKPVAMLAHVLENRREVEKK